MTLPEHAICSLMIAQLGVRERLGAGGVVCVTLAGIAPDLDTASKLFGDQYFWSLHHALGHSLLSISLLAVITAGAGAAVMGRACFGVLFRWCWLAAAAHCLTDALYWWGIQPLWPFLSLEWSWNVLEYLDLFVLAIWLAAAAALWRYRDRAQTVATMTLLSFSCYVLLRATLPPPTGLMRQLAGGWMYAAPQGTPVLDWW